MTCRRRKRSVLSAFRRHRKQASQLLNSHPLNKRSLNIRRNSLRHNTRHPHRHPNTTRKHHRHNTGSDRPNNIRSNPRPRSSMANSRRSTGSRSIRHSNIHLSRNIRSSLFIRRLLMHRRPISRFRLRLLLPLSRLPRQCLHRRLLRFSNTTRCRPPSLNSGNRSALPRRGLHLKSRQESRRG